MLSFFTLITPKPANSPVAY